MSVQLNPYLRFLDNAQQAVEFYHDVFGGTLNVHTFGDAGMSDSPDAKKVMHATLATTAGLTLMASDTPTGMTHSPGESISVSLSGDDADELRGYWSKLCEGGTVSVPLEKQMWGDVFGACTDRFGVPWMVNITEPTG